MKIAILNIYSGLVSRGAETIVAEALASKWTGKKHEVFFFCGGSLTKTNYKVHIIPGVAVMTPDTSGDLGDKIVHWLYRDPYSRQVREFTYRCLDELERIQPDIIVSFNGSEQVRILHQTEMLRNKVVVSMQGQNESRRWKLAGRENNRLINLRPRGMVAINAMQYELLKSSQLGEDNFVKIPNGVDLVFFHPNAVKTKLSLKPPVVLCVAALQYHKKVDSLIKAVRETDLSLLVLGDGPLREELTMMGSQILGRERFEIMTVAHDLIPGIYTAAEVFSLPSLPLEAFGVAYLEAMASNLPVVAPDDPVRRSIVEEAGLYVNVENAKEYALALTKARSISWGDKPRKQAAKFSWDIIAQKYIEFFNQII